MLIQLLIIQAVTFIGLLVLLRFLFYKQLGTAVTRLKHLHEENLAKEEELKKELEAIKLEREKELERARQESERLIKEARTKSEKISANMESEAKKQAQELAEKTKADLGKMEKDLAKKYMDEAIEASMEIFKAVFSEQSQEALQHELISELIAEVKNLGEDKFVVKSKDAKVISAYPLTGAEKEKLAHILSGKTGLSVELKETKNPDLIAGLVIQMGALTIDGSLKNKLKKVVPYLKEKGSRGQGAGFREK
jgi:F-type H+-transporting ATPase subunit b